MKKKTIISVFVFLIAVIVMLLVAIDNRNSNHEKLLGEEVNEQIETDDKNENLEDKELSENEVASGNEIISENEIVSENKATDISNKEISTEASNEDSKELGYQVLDIQTTMYAQKKLNVRSGPGISYNKVGTLIQNQEVIITGQADNGWYRIDFDGTVGFASNTLIGASPIVVAEAIPTTATVEIVQSDGGHNASYAQSVIDLVNSNRADNGLGSLTSTPELMSAAAKRAEEIVTLFEHQRPDGRSWSTIAAEYNIAYTTLGENIAEGQTTPDEVMTGWMNSPGHRENILKPEFGHIGVGSFQATDGRYYWAQLFTN